MWRSSGSFPELAVSRSRTSELPFTREAVEPGRGTAHRTVPLTQAVVCTCRNITSRPGLLGNTVETGKLEMSRTTCSGLVCTLRGGSGDPRLPDRLSCQFRDMLITVQRTGDYICLMFRILGLSPLIWRGFDDKWLWSPRTAAVLARLQEARLQKLDWSDWVALLHRPHL